MTGDGGSTDNAPMGRSCMLGFALLLATGCGGTEAAPTEEPTPTPAPASEPAAEPEEAEPLPGEVSAAHDATALAEAFVREQGYTDVPPTVGADGIVREGIEGSIEGRLGTLHSDSVSTQAEGDGEGWLVIFRYTAEQYAERGRAVRVRLGDSPRMVHQDVVLSAFVD